MIPPWLGRILARADERLPKHAGPSGRPGSPNEHRASESHAPPRADETGQVGHWAPRHPICHIWWERRNASVTSRTSSASYLLPVTSPSPAAPCDEPHSPSGRSHNFGLYLRRSGCKGERKVRRSRSFDQFSTVSALGGRKIRRPPRPPFNPRGSRRTCLVQPPIRSSVSSASNIPRRLGAVTVVSSSEHVRERNRLPSYHREACGRTRVPRPHPPSRRYKYPRESSRLRNHMARAPISRRLRIYFRCPPAHHPGHFPPSYAHLYASVANIKQARWEPPFLGRTMPP